MRVLDIRKGPNSSNYYGKQAAKAKSQGQTIAELENMISGGIESIDKKCELDDKMSQLTDKQKSLHKIINDNGRYTRIKNALNDYKK